MATKRHYKRRTYRKKKRTQKRRRGGEGGIMGFFGFGPKQTTLINKQPVEDLKLKKCSDSKSDYIKKGCSPTSDNPECKELTRQMESCS